MAEHTMYSKKKKRPLSKIREKKKELKRKRENKKLKKGLHHVLHCSHTVSRFHALSAAAVSAVRF